MATSIDYSRIRFLESPANVKRVLKGAMDREPSTHLSLDIAVCLQQGRLFYEAAEMAAPEIRPLLIFYGILNFAKALVVGRTGTTLEQLDRGHGLKDRSSNSDVLESLMVEVTGQGTFQQFNDTVRESDSVRFESLGEYVRRYIPSSPSASLQNKEVNLKAILGRIPGLEGLYRDTFEQEPNAVRCGIHYYDDPPKATELRFDLDDTFHNEAECSLLVNKLVERFPCLKNWCLCYARRAWGKSVIIFVNLDEAKVMGLLERKETRMQRVLTRRTDGSYQLDWLGEALQQNSPLSMCISRNFWEILDPVTGGLTPNTCLTEPVDGSYISELSLYYLGMYLLSSLVRYRPRIWARSISRLRIPGESADDRALALVERFMESSLSVFPSAIVDGLSLKKEE